MADPTTTILRILCVDDDSAAPALILESLREANPQSNYEILHVDDAAAFVSSLDKNPDVILCDFNMPKFSPYAALQILVARAAPIPLIVVSASVGEEAAVHVIRCGAKDYVSKSKLRNLSAIIERVVAERAAQPDGLQDYDDGHESDDEPFQLDPAKPVVLLLGAVDHEGVLSSITTGGGQYKKKILESKPENWQTIADIFQRFRVSGVMVKLTAKSIELLGEPNYADVRETVFSRVASSKNAIFVFEDFLTGKRSGWRQYPAAERIKQVISWMRQKELELIPYRRNAEVTVLAEAFVAETESNLFFRIYVPRGRIYSSETERFLVLFREYLGRVAKVAVRLDQRNTEMGAIYEFHGDQSTQPSQIGAEYVEFSQLMELCINDIDAAEALLVGKKIDSREVTSIITRYAKEARRLQLDLKHEKEQKLLAIRHRVESELCEMPLSAGDWNAINHLLELVLPAGPTSILALGGANMSSTYPSQVTINLRPQIVGKVEGIVAQEINGNQYLGAVEANILELIDLYGGARTAELRSALYESADKGAPLPNSTGAKKKIKSFLLELGSKGLDVTAGLLQSYLEGKMGL